MYDSLIKHHQYTSHHKTLVQVTKRKVENVLGKNRIAFFYLGLNFSTGFVVTLREETNLVKCLQGLFLYTRWIIIDPEAWCFYEKKFCPRLQSHKIMLFGSIHGQVHSNSWMLPVQFVYKH